LIVGGAHGNGEVYEQGRLVGYSSITQLTLGAQLGGQAYRQIVFFADQVALDEFKAGDFNFGAQASAVAVTAGAAANAAYDNGVAVFTLPLGGLMFEASIAGQNFSFKPVADSSARVD
jgi:lipid-binding SYLF domain-containing protein